MRPESPVYLWDARTASHNALSFVEGIGFDDYHRDLKTRSAVERQLEIVGEALNNLRRVDPAAAAQIPDVHAIIATRNILVHGYAQIDDEQIWEILGRDLPELLPVLDALLARADPPA